MEFKTSQNNTTAKLPILKLGEYDMWEMRIKQYFQNGTSVTKMSVPITADEKINKKNDIKAKSLLLMAIPNEYQLTFSQHDDAKTMFSAIKTRFGGNKATKKTQKVLLKQQYENFNASSTESLDSIFNRLKTLVNRLAILVWMNKPDIETMSIHNLYNNFKIVEQEVKKSIGASNGDQNIAFMSSPSTSSTNDEVSTASPKVRFSLDISFLGLLGVRGDLYIRGMIQEAHVGCPLIGGVVGGNNAGGYEFDNHQPQETPEVTPFVESKEWIETNNELYKMMEDFTERMNQELHKQEVLLAAQREQELLAQKQAAQEKKVPSPNSVFRQLIKEMCGTRASAEQKQNMEDTMLDLLKVVTKSLLL
ncbi:hypothetical protein Tco_0337835 [Tanacetum coccineum]